MSNSPSEIRFSQTLYVTTTASTTATGLGISESGAQLNRNLCLLNSKQTGRLCTPAHAKTQTRTPERWTNKKKLYKKTVRKHSNVVQTMRTCSMRANTLSVVRARFVYVSNGRAREIYVCIAYEFLLSCVVGGGVSRFFLYTYKHIYDRMKLFSWPTTSQQHKRKK